MVYTIADKNFTKLTSNIPPKPSWTSFIDAQVTPENGCLGFGQQLNKQFAVWEDACDKKFVIDHFNASCLDKKELREGDIVTYHPTSFGEKLDFWFEIDFKVENEQLTAVFDINFQVSILQNDNRIIFLVQQILSN